MGLDLLTYSEYWNNADMHMMGTELRNGNSMLLHVYINELDGGSTGPSKEKKMKERGMRKSSGGRTRLYT